MDLYAPPPDEAELIKVMADYLAQAQSPTLDERRAGVEGLYELAIKLGPRIAESIPVLVEALLESDEKLGESASWALAYCAPESVEPLIECLAHSCAHVRERAAHSLGNIGPCAMVAAPALRQGLTDAEQSVRSRAAWALGMIRDTGFSTLTALFSMAQRGTAGDLAAALHAAGNIGRELDDPQPLRAHETLILDAMHNSDENVRWSAGYASEALQMAPEREAELLADLLMNENTERVADRLLSRMKELAPSVDLEASVPLVIAQLQHKGRRARLACEVLAAMRPAPLVAIADLQQLLANEGLRLAAAEALWRIEGRAETILPALALEFEGNGEGVCDLICSMKAAAAPLLPHLLEALANEDYWDLQWAAADALDAVASSSPDVMAALIKAMQHPSPRVRSSSARALARAGAPAVPALLAVLTTGDDHDAAGAAYALGKMGAPAAPAIQALRQGIASSHPDLSSCCVIAVTYVASDPAMVPHLARLLKSDDPDVPKCAAAKALAHLGPAASAAVPTLEALLAGIEHETEIGLAEAVTEALGVLKAAPN
jgi:HEAT repeat protein